MRFRSLVGRDYEGAVWLGKDKARRGGRREAPVATGAQPCDIPCLGNAENIRTVRRCERRKLRARSKADFGRPQVDSSRLVAVIDDGYRAVFRIEPESAFDCRCTGCRPDDGIKIRIEVYARCPTAEGNTKQELIGAARRRR